MNCRISLLIFLLICVNICASAQMFTLSSPNGSITASFNLDEGGTPTYQMSAFGTPIINKSKLGFLMRGETRPTARSISDEGIVKYDKRPPFSLYNGLSLAGEVERESFQEVWSPVWGEESEIENKYNSLLIPLKGDNGKAKMNIRFRLFDTGLAFRYEFPEEQERSYICVIEEMTEFNMAGDCESWWIPGDFDSQEYDYSHCKLSEISSKFVQGLRPHKASILFSTSGIQTPLLLKTPEGLYVNIHEAALIDFPCMYLEADCANHSLRSYLTPDGEGYKGRIQTPFCTPWRSIEVSEKATEMLASRQILNLNEPCVLDDVTWIRPVKYIGVWWEMIAGASKWSYTDDFKSVRLGQTDYAGAKPHGKHGAANENVRKYIDFAADNGFDAVLVEGWNIGWEDWYGCNKEYVFDFVTPYPDFDIKALNEYAHSRGVKLMMHHETSSSPRNYERHLKAAYELMNRYGYDCVKSGYVGDILPEGMNHSNQWMVNHYLYCIKEAAKHRIMVNAHEAVRPTGLCRTWPNLICNESALGSEYHAIGGIKPGHTAILPFTRLKGGPMDYTPGLFEQDLKSWCGNDNWVNSTICGQLALYVTMSSPLQMAADTPEHYSKHMDAFQFIKDVALDWKESIYLFAEPGKYIIVARKAKDSGKWFIGGVTDGKAREFDIPLDYIGEGKYTAKIYADGPNAHYRTNAKSYTISEKEVTARSSIKVRMAPGGGFAISIN